MYTYSYVHCMYNVHTCMLVDKGIKLYVCICVPVYMYVREYTCTYVYVDILCIMWYTYEACGSWEEASDLEKTVNHFLL